MVQYGNCRHGSQSCAIQSSRKPVISVLLIELADTNIRELKHEWQPVVEPPKAIREQGLRVTQSYLPEKSFGTDDMCPDTVNMLGDVCTGKTSIAQSLVLRSPNPADKDDRTRVMQQLCAACGEDGKLLVNINDFGGHHIYHTVIPIFLPTKCLVLLAYDMSLPLKDQECTVRRWLLTAMAKFKYLRVILVGTRCDAISRKHREYLEKHMRRFVSSLLLEVEHELKHPISCLKQQRSAYQYEKKSQHLCNLVRRLEHVDISVLEQLMLGENDLFKGVNPSISRLRRLKKLFLGKTTTVPDWIGNLEMDECDRFYTQKKIRQRRVTVASYDKTCNKLLIFFYSDEKEASSIAQNVGRGSYHHFLTKQYAAWLQRDHLAGAQNELRKWPGRCGLNLERGSTRVIVYLCLLGRNGQGATDLPNERRSSRQLRRRHMLQLLDHSRHVNQRRSTTDYALDWRQLALPFDCWASEAFTDKPAETSVDRPVPFELVQDSDMPAEAFCDKHTTVKLKVPYDSHDVNVVPLKHLSTSPASSPYDATAEATYKDCKASANRRLHYDIARVCNSDRNMEADVSRAKMIKCGESIVGRSTTCVTPRECKTRLVDDYAPRPYNRLCDAVVYTGAVLFGASATSDQQFLGGKRQFLAQLAVGLCQNGFSLELLRLASLVNWPHLGKLSALRCCSAGFHRMTSVGLTFSEDGVTCFSCGCTVEKWSSGVLPLALHRDKCGQHCHFIAEPLNSGNVPLGKEPILLPVSERARQLAAPSSVATSSTASTSEIPSAADCMSSLGVGPSSKLPVAPVLGSYSDAGLAAIASGSSLVKELVAASRRTAAGTASASRDDELTKHESYRLDTFCNVWAYDHIVDARELARNGFFYAGPGDRVQCAFCQGLLRNWEPGDRVDEQHAQHFTYCRFVQGHDVGNVPIPFWPLTAKQASDVHAADTIDASGADLGITSTPPKNPEFAIEARRLSTFATWPANHHLQPDILAKAGFFYLGKEDAARCFFCDGTVVDWRTDCDPWVEHAHRFPSCSFVLQVKGHDFVQRHRMQNPPAASSSRPSLAVDPREVRARMDSNKVRVLLHMDYPLDLVREVVQKRLATVGSDHESSEQLLEDVFQTHDEKQRANSTQGAARRATSDSSGPVVVARTPARGPDELGVQSLPNDVVQSRMVAMAASAPAAARTDSSLPMYNPMAAADKLPPLTSLPTTAQLPEEENRQLKTQLTCKVCMDSLVGIVFLPCGHLVCCASCAPAMTTCPICRVSIRGTVRTVL